jgi:hypothetical protein
MDRRKVVSFESRDAVFSRALEASAAVKRDGISYSADQVHAELSKKLGEAKQRTLKTRGSSS